MSSSTPSEKFEINGPIHEKQVAARAFWDIFSDRIYKVFSDLPALWRTSDDYSEEQKVIKQVTMPFFYSGVASVVIFANLRLIASPSFQKWIGRRDLKVPKQKSNAGEEKRPSNRNQLPQEYKSYLTIEREKRNEKIQEELNFLSGWPFDFLLSALVGMSFTSFLFTGRNNMDWNRYAFETAPLLPGKSLVAKYMCGDMMNVQDRMTTALRNEVENDVTLNSFRKFVKNCQLRQEEEERIREELQLNEEDEVMIPLPGIADPEPRQKLRDLSTIPDPFSFSNSGYNRDDAKKDEKE